MQDSYKLFNEKNGKLYCNECDKEAFMGLKAGPWCITCKNQFEELKSS